MAGLDLASASRYLHLQQQHYHHQYESQDQHVVRPTNRFFSGIENINNNNNNNGYEDDDDQSGQCNNNGLDLVAQNITNSQGDDIAVVRRPRGRPAGSKNKPKPQVIITRESANTLRAHILEVGSGCDLFDCMASYAQRRQRGICIMSGSGVVNNVRLRQLTVPEAVVTLHGRFEILSLAGSFLPPPAPPGATSLTIFLAGGQGQVVGGVVVGELVAVGPVIVIAASFTNVEYDKLPMDEQDEMIELPPINTASSSEGGGGNGLGLPVGTSTGGGGLPFLNLPLGMGIDNNGQMGGDQGWGGGANGNNNSSGVMPRF